MPGGLGRQLIGMDMTEFGSPLRNLGCKLALHPGPFALPWPGGQAGSPLRTFATFSEWLIEIEGLGLSVAVPTVLTEKYERAQKVYLAGWLDQDIIKAGEMAAFTALEFALNDRYGDKVKSRQKPKKPELMSPPPPKSLSDLVDYMVIGDGLTDEVFPFSRKYGFAALQQVWSKGTMKPSLVDRRNSLFHGHLGGNLPVSGLLELIRDLIDYAYRDWGKPNG